MGTSTLTTREARAVLADWALRYEERRKDDQTPTKLISEILGETAQFWGDGTIWMPERDTPDGRKGRWLHWCDNAADVYAKIIATLRERSEI